MSKPAARIGDHHICPMFDGPKPHVGGPILPPCMPTVLVGSKPAARLGDLLTCVSPAPDTIVEGCFTILIGGKPASTILHSTAHGGKIMLGEFTVLYGGSTINASNPIIANPDVLALVSNSPTLVNKVDGLLKDGWKIENGAAGGGSFCDKTEKKIVIDSNDNGDKLGLTQTLAHEAGHAAYTADPYVAPDGLTKEEYVQANTNSQLKDEGEATLTNAEVREEILDNTTEDIGIAGTQTSDYEKISEEYTDGKMDRDTARQQIADAFADGEKTSTTNETYRDYYSKTYEDFYDDNVVP